MEHILHHRLHRDTKSIPEEQLFFVHRDKLAALGVKIRGTVYTSAYWSAEDKNYRPHLDKAMKQMAVLIQTGWSPAGEIIDEFGLPDTLFRCAYCYQETTTPSGSCICRRMRRMLQQKGEVKKSSSIIIP